MRRFVIGVVLGGLYGAIVQAHEIQKEDLDYLSDAELGTFKEALNRIGMSYCPYYYQHKDIDACRAKAGNITYEFLACHVAFDEIIDIYRCYETLSEYFYREFPAGNGN